MSWTLDTLKSNLSKRTEVKAWIVSQEHVHRRERYFLNENPALSQASLAVDQDRESHSQSISARIFVHLGRDGRQGEITKKLFTALPLQPQIDDAIAAALQTDHQAWELPKDIPSQLPKVLTTDPRMAEDLEGSVKRLSDQVREAVETKRATAFNSAELFLSVQNRDVHLSNGLTHRASQSRIYVEAAYSMSKKLSSGEIQSDEYLNTSWSVNEDDLAIGELFQETSFRAEHSLDVKKPATGKYSVIVDAEVLATLFNGHLGQLSAVSAYNRLPFVKIGESLIPDATGDLLTITLDPSLEFGADTAAVSDQGLLQPKLELVKANQVVATCFDKQHADYLGAKPTTVRGNVVVEPGKLTHSELTKQAPRVIEVLQFSGLFADPNSGTFSSEIRLAKLYDNVAGTVTYLKGGSLSGSVTENFKGVRLSKETEKKAHFDVGSTRGSGYFGPKFALLSDVSIVG